jgi:putative membrane protein
MKTFDEQYMQGMATDHNKAVNLFQQEARSGSSVHLKQFALKTLPTLQEHQKMALELTHKVTQASAR